MLIAEHYEILDELGRGGMSTVYRAIDHATQREVALKILHVHDQLEQIQRRFFGELLSTSGVHHPNIVRIHDFGISTDLGLPFIVMDLLNGTDLESWLQDNGRLPAARALPLFHGLLGALAALHERGIVHKDIKPSNIFFNAAGAWNESLILTDFGIAHCLETSRATPLGMLACTPQYCAPEYLTHQIVSPSTDVYQMGLVLLESLFGWPLVSESSIPLTVLAHCEGTLRIPRLALHSPLRELIHGSLSRTPDARFPNAVLMQQALSRIDPRALTLSIELIQSQASQ